MNAKWWKYGILMPVLVCAWLFVVAVEPSIPESPFNFGVVKYSNVLKRAFEIKNRSLLPMEIVAVIPACECTTAKLRKRIIPPLGSTFIDVTFKTEGFHGKVTRFIDIELAKPQKCNVQLTFDVTVKGGPEKGLEKIIFSEPCAKCHVTPGINKMGKELYDAVCLMCHTDGKGALPINRGEWTESHTDITRHGITGANMPGYSKNAGGNLSEAQILSIVEYFSKN